MSASYISNSPITRRRMSTDEREFWVVTPGDDDEPMREVRLPIMPPAGRNKTSCPPSHPSPPFRITPCLMGLNDVFSRR